MVTYQCTICNVYTYDDTKGDEERSIPSGMLPQDFPDEWRCPVCGARKSFLKEIIADTIETKEEPTALKIINETPKQKRNVAYYNSIAAEKLAGTCSVNKVCDGHPDRLCTGEKYGGAIGFGGAGQGKTFDANFRALAQYKFKMRVVKAHHEPEMEIIFLGKKISLPVLTASMSGVAISMNNAMSEPDFQRGLIEGAKLFGTIALSGNTPDHPDHPGVGVIKENEGWGIPVFKPQAQDKLLKLFQRATEANAIAIGVDLDGCGSTNWALRGKPVYRKSPAELKELVDCTDKQVIFKGIMTPEDAAHVVDSGASALGISNHGGRVLDYGQGVAEVLPEIAKEFKGKITILADGAVRTGYDVLKIIALGADVALIGRPLARMSLAGGTEAVNEYLNYVKKDLRLAMLMTGCDSLQDATMDIVVKVTDVI